MLYSVFLAAPSWELVPNHQPCRLLRSVAPTLMFLLALQTTTTDAVQACHDSSSEAESFLWTKVQIQNNGDDGPKNFSQSGNAAIGKNIYVFGGNHQFGSTFYDGFYAFDTETNRWTQLPKGPSPRAFPGVSASMAGHFLLYGGTDTFQFDSNYKALDDFWLYSVKNNEWEKMDNQHPNPGPRTGATLFVDDETSKVYLFGGFVDFSTEPPNDVWEFNFPTEQWTQLIPDTRPQGQLPLGRNIASGGPVVVKKNNDGRPKLLVYGGEGFNLTTFKFPILDDLWEFDITTHSWTEITAGNDGETPKRNYAGNAIVGDYLYLFGGDVAGVEGGRGACGGVFPENPTDEIWRYQVETQQWETITTTGDPFVRVKDQGQASVVNGDKIYLVGGYSCVPGASGQGERAYINDVYVLESRCRNTSKLLDSSAATAEL